ncbi:MAG: hypothetical protein HOV94_25875, partial [Saccharothrix sp.]|nr:hypothetical protein [Saccharothrix sp.]
MERIAPAVLVGREAELAELHAFCVDPATAGSYRWWQAAPWAGKSALMSSFVLSAPAGVRVVSFFVTARLAGQADRVAFVDNVLEQVLALLDEQLPPFLTPATREAQLLGLLEDAARLCAERGESLVLVIDGLDEDRGVTAGPDPHSIAGLLPVRLPEGMRVVVAGRADPPLPGDVHPDHPLRDPGVVRVLRASPRARLLREEMENELSRLLDDEGGGRELLGLLTAAGGGLTAADLAELVTQEPWRVGRRLRTVAGRSFTRRESRAAPGGGADVYLLGHEQLQVTALDMLGPALTAGYRERVHAWAEDYRARGWPRDTPEYLLHGYHTMLLGTGDLDRAAALCADRDRQRLLLATTGGDNAAHTQITTTLDALVERDPVDLTTIGRLAVHRDRLGDRNSRIPRGLAAVWARLGHDTRAATLAQSVIDPVERTRALVSVAAVSSEAGRQDVAAGLLDLALDSARSIAEPGTRDWALLWVSEESARAGNHHQAVEATRTITGTELRHRALVSVVELLSDVGRQDLADGLIDHALKVIGLITHPFWKGMAQVWAAKVLARSRRQDEADHLFDEAFREIRSLDRAHQEVALPLLAVSSVEAGDKSRAVEVVRLIAKSRSGSEALVRVAMALIKSGDPDRAVGLLGQAAEEARSIPHATARVRAWTSVAEALVEVGDHDRAAGLLAQAVETTQSIAEADARAETLVVVARAWVTMGAHDRAVGLLGQAVDQVRSVGDSKSRSTVLVAVAEALVGAGDRDRAVEVALSVADPGKRGEALVAVAGVLAETGVVEPAVELLTQAVEVTQSIPDPGQESRMSVAVAEVLSKDGDHDRAVAVARSRAGRVLRSPVLA